MEWHKKYGERYEHLTKSLQGMNSIQERFDSTGKATDKDHKACRRRTCWDSTQRATAGRSSPTATRTRPGTRPSTCRVRNQTSATSTVTSVG
ncbi:hypothetical protein ACFQ3Z_28660 [Streptomyces nogalater]